MAQNKVEIQLSAVDNATSTFKSVGSGISELSGRIQELKKIQQDAARSILTAPDTSSWLESKADLKKVTEDLSLAEKELSETTKSLGIAQDGTAQSSSSLFKTFTVGTLAANAIQKGIQLATDAIKASIDAASNYERSLMGLNSAGAAFGFTANQMNAAIKQVTDDGLLGFSTAAVALKTLLSTGMDIDTATMLMARFKDEAAFGRKETLTYGQAVENLAQAYKTQSSTLGDAAGHTDNFSNALEVGAAALGKTVEQLTAAETEQAKLIGYMQQGAYTAGDAAVYMDTYAGSVARMEAEGQKASVSLGQVLMPAVEFTTGAFADMLQSVNKSSKGIEIFQGSLVTIVAIAQTAIQVFVGLGQAIMGTVQAILSRDMNKLNEGINRATQGFVNIWENYDTQMKKIMNSGADAAANAHKESLDRMTQENGAASVKMQQQIDDATRQYQRSMESRNRSFQESVKDMVIAHRDKSRSIQSDIAKEQAAYDAANLKRKESYEDDIASLEERHLDKVQDIEAQIAEEREKGLVVDGILYQEANEKKIAKLEDQLRNETETYQKSIDKRKAQYSEDVSADKKRHDEKLSQLQISLNEELVILNRHRADVAQVGEAVKEDDLSRLKRSFAEQNTEAARNYAEQLERIRKQGNELGISYTNSMKDGVSAGSDKVKDQIAFDLRRAVSSGGLVIGDGGKAAADTFWTKFNKSIGDGVDEAGEGIKLNLEKAIKSGGLGISGGVDISNIIFGATPRAGGGTTRPGETTLVGERGPEIAQFPAGTRIIPTQQTRQILSQQPQGRQTTVNIGTVVNQSNMDPDAFFSALAWQIR